MIQIGNINVNEFNYEETPIVQRTQNVTADGRRHSTTRSVEKDFSFDLQQVTMEQKLKIDEAMASDKVKFVALDGYECYVTITVDNWAQTVTENGEIYWACGISASEVV